MSRKKKDEKKAQKLEIREDKFFKDHDKALDELENERVSLGGMCERCKDNIAMESSGLCPDCYMELSTELSKDITDDDLKPLKFEVDNKVSKRLNEIIGE